MAPRPSHSFDRVTLSNLQILNDKSDEDAEENRRNSGDGNRGVSQPSALLSQLLSSSNGPSGNGRQQESSDNYLERIAGVKRKFEEAKGVANNSKRATPENQQVCIVTPTDQSYGFCFKITVLSVM